MFPNTKSNVSSRIIVYMIYSILSTSNYGIYHVRKKRIYALILDIVSASNYSLFKQVLGIKDSDIFQIQMIKIDPNRK
ncbi:hypothetical protein C6356_29380 [Bacillus wiedmannii]|nr:hypothetical protein C6356_29380 [Bacillus wiedmannii]